VETEKAAVISRGRAGCDPESLSAQGRGRPTGGARETERGSGERSGRTDGPGEKESWWAMRVRGRKERERERRARGSGPEPSAGKREERGERDCGPSCRGRERKGEREREKEAGWAGPKGEEREGAKERRKTKNAFEFEHEI
jgi:hypothetical protein